MDKSLALTLGAVLGFLLEQKFVPFQDALSNAPETRKDFLTIYLYFLFQPLIQPFQRLYWHYPARYDTFSLLPLGPVLDHQPPLPEP